MGLRSHFGSSPNVSARSQSWRIVMALMMTGGALVDRGPGRVARFLVALACTYMLRVGTGLVMRIGQRILGTRVLAAHMM